VAEKLGDCKLALESYRVAVGELKGAERDKHRKKCLQYEKQYEKQEKEHEYQKSLNVRDELLGDATAAIAGGSAAASDDPDAAMQLGRDTMVASKQSLDNVKSMIANSYDVGKETLEKVGKQNDQMKGMMGDLGEMDSILSRSGVIIKRMLRKAGTDKWLWCMIFIVIVMIIVVISYKIAHPNADAYSPSQLAH